MSEPAPRIFASRVIVIMPNWLGDGVMATAFLRGLRYLYPAAHVAAAARPLVAPVCEGLVDEVKVYKKGEEGAVTRWMKAERFDLGILLPNSFRSAWMLWRGGVRRRLGYARGGRSWLLTDRVVAARRTPAQRALDGQRARAIQKFGGGSIHVGSNFQPIPTILYYRELLLPLGGEVEDGGNGTTVTVSDRDRAEAQNALRQLSLENYIVIVPGANFGSSKCWAPERFAALAEKLADPAGRFGTHVLLVGSPAETPICTAIIGAMQRHKDRVLLLGSVNNGAGVSIGALKEIVRRARMMICNDTGPRHIAAAFGVPLVTLFGPTDPVWAETFALNERIVRIDVPCGPCQLKTCPIDHRCMKGITVEMVMAAVEELWK